MLKTHRSGVALDARWQSSIQIMHPIITRTLGGLSAAYYFRQFVFGSGLAAFIAWMSSRSPHPVPAALVFMLLVNTLLYPYFRFVYEGIVRFIVGENIFLVNAVFMLVTKMLTMAFCWGGAIFIAPVGLLYLYVHHSRANA